MFSIFKPAQPQESHPYAKRLSKEYKDLVLNPPPGIKIQETDKLTEWIVNVMGAENTIYQNEHFLVRFRFGKNYPLDSPEVVFLTNAPSGIPKHPHIYSNGHICLSILYDTWSPALTTQSVCLSLLSMLSSSKSKERPPDDGVYMMRAPASPKDAHWIFHDDSV